MKVKSCLFIFIFFCLQVNAQVIHQFTKGLAIGPCHQYGREALYTDQLAYQLYTGTLSTPANDQTLFTDEKGEAVKWQGITADNENTFKGNALSNGYLYLTYESDRQQTALLNVAGHTMLYINGVPRAGDMYRYGWVYLPILLKKGVNEVYIRTPVAAHRQGITARLIFPEKPLALSIEDPTLPHILLGDEKAGTPLWAATVVINASDKPFTGLQLISRLEGKEMKTNLPIIPPMTTRKVGFQIDPSAVQAKSKYTCKISLQEKNTLIDEKEITLQALGQEQHHSNTFVSHIDGSVQYYSVAPQSKSDGNLPALFLSVHGAEVEAINQARAYQPKDWGVLVAPTNRRPRGFNWEDWGRLDAMEVLEIAKQKFKPDPSRIYLTGHSMGGHGTWYLGATFPGNWAAIAPCAGYPTLSSYGSHDGKIPENSKNMIEKMLLRSSNPSNVFALSSNYKAGGVYILHGDNDKTVSVEYARQMRNLLGSFHADFNYYEYPGGSHWYGNHSVDWQPIFDYFKWHTIPSDSAVDTLEFTTANPAISSKMFWASITQQIHPLQYSNLKLIRNKSTKTISGHTENVSRLQLNLAGFIKGDTIKLTIDSLPPINYIMQGEADMVHVSKNTQWEISSTFDPASKGAHRNGTFKEAFNNRMVFVYGTAGSKKEKEWAYNKARYDAETWYYRANGSVDLIADKDFTPNAYADRGVILYGNAQTNSAWKKLLKNCPIQVQRGKLTAGKINYTGNDLSTYFVWPRPDSKVASVAVISGTGLPGMQAADANQYFSGGSGFPDFMIFKLNMVKEGIKGVQAAGYFGNDWRLESGEMVERK